MLKYIDGWKKVLPDYQFMFWNEETFDVNQYPFTKFISTTPCCSQISNFVRLWALYKYGGIYLDTDVEVLKSFDDLLDKYKSFSSFDKYPDADVNGLPRLLNTGVIASEKGAEWLKYVYEQLYKDRDNITHFVNHLKIKTNGNLILELIKDNPDKFKDLTILPAELLSPHRPTKNTYCFHHWAHSWFGDTFGYLRTKT